MLFALPFPTIDPVLVEVGPFVIRWYALAYVAGLVIGWRTLRGLVAQSPTAGTAEDADDFLLWATFGVILGGRIGYVVFYNFSYFSAQPMEIFMVWKGGMSFHGGLLGVIAATVLFCRQRKLPLLAFGDRLAVVAPIGLLFGRLANFINGELFGRVTDVSWGVVFPRGGPLPRHPSQIYESLLEGALLFTILFILSRQDAVRARAGTLIGLFLMGYGLARSFVELFRQPDAHIGFLGFGVTMGQALSLPMVALGVLLIWAAKQKTTEG